jgi:threonine aldolase
VYVALPADVTKPLDAAGFGAYGFGDPADGITRLLCSFDTTEGDVRALVGVIEQALA